MGILNIKQIQYLLKEVLTLNGVNQSCHHLCQRVLLGSQK